MSIEDKVNFLLYLNISFLVLLAYSIAKTWRKNVISKLKLNYITKIQLWDSEGKHGLILKEIDRILKRFPGEVDFIWAKAKAMYKIENFKESREIFVDIAKNEPLCKDDAQKYISSIDERSSQ